MEKPANNRFQDPEILNSKVYKISNEVFNAVAHGIGCVLAILGTVLLVVKGFREGTFTAVLAYLIYGISMILMFLNSTLYHCFTFTKVAPVFQFLDHASIYLLIAGTYTPFCLITIQGKLGWGLFLTEWLLALTGIIAKAIQARWIEKYSTLVYLAMGWLCLVAIRPIWLKVPHQGLAWLLAGGLLYSIGTYFYKNDDRYTYFHVIWHLFVLLASACMFVAIYFYV